MRDGWRRPRSCGPAEPWDVWVQPHRRRLQVQWCTTEVAASIVRESAKHRNVSETLAIGEEPVAVIEGDACAAVATFLRHRRCRRTRCRPHLPASAASNRYRPALRGACRRLGHRRCGRPYRCGSQRLRRSACAESRRRRHARVPRSRVLGLVVVLAMDHQSRHLMARAGKCSVGDSDHRSRFHCRRVALIHTVVVRAAHGGSRWMGHRPGRRVRRRRGCTAGRRRRRRGYRGRSTVGMVQRAGCFRRPGGGGSLHRFLPTDLELPARRIPVGSIGFRRRRGQCGAVLFGRLRLVRRHIRF